MAKPKMMLKPQLKKQVTKSLVKSNINKKAKGPVAVTKIQTKEKIIKNVKKDKLVKAQIKEDGETKSKEVIDTKMSEISDERLMKAVELTYNLIKKREEKNVDKISLLDEEVPIFLQVDCMKIPKCPLRTVRFALPHTLVNESTDICLIVPDLKKGRKVDSEPTLIHYQDMLSSAGITNITVLPFTQLKLEYSQFEAKRRLLNLYDVFLVDGKISGHVFHVLGKIFLKARKLPTSIRLNEKDLKAEINKALSKTSIVLTPRGSTSIVKVGHNKLSTKQVTENTLAAIKWLGANYPGGLPNIQNLAVKGPNTPSVPFYCSLKCRNEVKIPVVVHHKKNMYLNASGELSTILGATVSFEADGRLKVKQEKVEGMSDEELSPKPKNLKKKANDQAGKPDAKKIKKAEPQEDEESDNEESIEEENSGEENDLSDENVSDEVSAEEEEVIKSLRVPRNVNAKNKGSKQNKTKPAKKALAEAPKGQKSPVEASKGQKVVKAKKEQKSSPVEKKSEKAAQKTQKASPVEALKAPAKAQKAPAKAQKNSPLKDGVEKVLKKKDIKIQKSKVNKVQKQKFQKKFNKS